MLADREHVCYHPPWSQTAADPGAYWLGLWRKQEAEASMVTAGLIPDVEILKVGHHGSRTASSSALLAAAKPEVAIYMAGTGNRYGHPHAETIAALQAIGATIYGTEVKGDIAVTTDGQTYSVTTER